LDNGVALPEEIRNDFSPTHKQNIAKDLIKINGGRPTPQNLFCLASEDCLSLLSLLTLAGDESSAKLLSDGVEFYASDLDSKTRSLAVYSAEGLILSGQLGSRDLTEGCAKAAIYMCCCCLNQQGDVHNGSKMRQHLAAARRTNPDLVPKEQIKPFVGKLRFVRQTQALIREVAALEVLL
jgi:hypothetical protein